MAKKGVSKITGSKSPKIGQPASYVVTEWYPSTPLAERTGADVKWELFRKRSNGQYTSTNIIKKGPVGIFIFEEKSYGHEFFVEGYLNTPEKKGNTIIYVKPVKGDPKISGLRLLDSNKSTIKEKPKYGQTLYAEVKTQNMFNEKVKLEVWERDTTSDTGHNEKENTLLWNREITVNLNGINYESIVLTELMMKRSQGGNIFEGEHEYYLVVKYKSKTTYSNQTVQVLNEKIQVKGIGSNPPPANNGKSPAIVKEQPKQEEKKGKEGKCTRCEEEITVEQLKQVYENATDNKLLEELAKVLNKYRKTFGLDTCARKAHFFAQSREEAGSSLEPGVIGESFNYYKDNLALVPLKAFETVEGQRIAQTYGRQQRASSPDVSEAYQIILANWAYGPQYRTGQNFKNKDNDGWNFRGRGLLQITGRSNYEEIQGKINKLAPNSGVDILKRFDSPNKAISRTEGRMTAEEAALTGLIEWIHKKMHLQADKTGELPDEDVVGLIVDTINKYTDSRAKREEHYRKTKGVFNVGSCKNINGSKKDGIGEKNQFGLVQLTKIGNPYIINYGLEDSYSYKKKDGSMSIVAKHGDDWIKPEKAFAFSESVYKLVKEFPNQKIHLNDCSAYNPAFNLGHSANGGHSRGEAFDCKFLTVNGNGTNHINSLTTEDIKINARFIEILKDTGYFSQFYADGGKIPGTRHASGHADHLHGN